MQALLGSSEGVVCPNCRRPSPPDFGNRPISSLWLAGFRFSKCSPVAGSTHLPLMKFLKTLGAGIWKNLLGLQRRPASGDAGHTCLRRQGPALQKLNITESEK